MISHWGTSVGPCLCHSYDMQLSHKISVSVNMIISPHGWYIWILQYFMPLLWLLSHIRRPTCLPVLLPELALAVLALLKCSRSTHPSSAAFLVCKDLHSCNLAQVSLWRDKLLLVGDVVIACRGRVIRKKCQLTLAFACWKGHIYESYVNPGALFLLLVKYNAILNSDGRKLTCG